MGSMMSVFGAVWFGLRSKAARIHLYTPTTFPEAAATVRV